MKKFLSLLALSCIGMGAWAEDWTVSLPANRVISVSETAANSFEPATSANDNSHWYVLQQSRGKLTPVQVPTSGNISRTSDVVGTVITNNGTYLADATAYLVRLVPGDYEGAYKIQSATGKYFGTGNASKTSVDNNTSLQGYEYSKGDNFLVYNINSQNQHIGFSYTNNGTSYVKMLDNNGNGSSISYWGDGQVSSVNGNNDWRVFEVTISAEEYFDVTYVLNNAFGEECQVVKKAVQGNTLVQDPALDYFVCETFTDSDCKVSSTNTTFHATGTWSMPIDENKYYTIKPNNSSNNFVAYGTDYAICNNTVSTYIGNDVWKFTHVANTPNLYTLQNVNYGYATVASSANQTVLTYQNEPSAWTSGTGKSSYFRITKNATGFNLQHPGDANANAGNHVGGKLGFWNNGSSSTAPGSRIEVAEFTTEMVSSRIDAAKTTVTNLIDIMGESAATTATNALNAVSGTVGEKLNGAYSALNTYYAAANGKKFTYESRMYNTNRYLKAADATAALQTSATSALTAKNVFEFEHVSDNNFKVKAPYYNTYLNSTSTSETASVYNLLVHGANYVGLQFYDTTNAIHHQQYGNTPVSYSSNTDASKWYLALVTDEQWAELNSCADFEVLQQRITKANAYTAERIGSDLNQYTWTVNGQNKNAQWASTLANYQTIVDEATASKYEVETYKAEVSAMIAALVINQPKANSFIRIRNAGGSNKRISCVNQSGSTRLQCANDENVDKIFFYDGTHLLAYKTGMYIGVASDFLTNCTDVNANNGTTFSFPASPVKIGTYNVVFNGNRYLHDDGNAGSNAANSSDTKYTFWLEEVTSIPVTIASNGLATFYAPVDMQVPDGTTAYAASLDDEETTITYSPFADNIIPAGHGALLKGTNGTINLVPTTGATEKESALVGHEYTVACSQTEDSHGASVIYTLQSTGNFKYYTGTKLTGFKAHFELKDDHRDSSGNSPLRVVFEDDLLTGIEIVDSNSSNQIFDLQGRRVNNAQKGLYIVNGRKVIR